MTQKWEFRYHSIDWNMNWRVNVHKVSIILTPKKYTKTLFGIIRFFNQKFICNLYQRIIRNERALLRTYSVHTFNYSTVCYIIFSGTIVHIHSFGGNSTFLRSKKKVTNVNGLLCCTPNELRRNIYILIEKM